MVEGVEVLESDNVQVVYIGERERESTCECHHNTERGTILIGQNTEHNTHSMSAQSTELIIK